MSQQESPIMDKAPETVTFFSTTLNYTLHVRSEKKGFDGEVPFIIPARLIRFVGGNYSTDDEELIKLIRNCKSYRNGKVTEEAKKEVLEAQKTHRGAITSGSMRKEAGVEEKAEAMALKEKGIGMCDVPGCDYIVKDDFVGNKLRMHKLGKHRSGMRPKAPSKKLAEELAEAKKGLEIKE